ncbi:hypothetical protein D1953_16470 [Peribacillus asahii]|uniref:Uncharacterized protein n=1 Tax=Peribacillus asahii TaxID=228899 RepID=A0A398B6M9_9BACI|nr:hypothetical protein [Peribacillus asahii]RID83343.1 hypothetical protein D1953_16470 [Peribacillus asahii]
MKKNLILAAGFISIGLLSTCMQEEKSEVAEVQETNEANKSVKVSESVESEQSDYSDGFQDSVSREKAITPEIKEMVKDNFEYFDKIVNNNYFYESRNADPNDPMLDLGKEDAWLTEEVKLEVEKRANEIEALLPTKNANLDRDLYMALGEIRTGFDYENGGDIYLTYRILYGLHTGMNGYEHVDRDENGRKRFDPEGNWTATFTDEEIGYEDPF